MLCAPPATKGADVVPSTMDDETWRRFRRYADQVVVAVKPTELPHQTDSTEEWVIVSSAAEWDPEWLVREVESIALDFQLDGKQIAADHVIDAREHRFSWGGDAAKYEIVMWLVTWAATSASWDLLKLLSRKMSHKLEHDEPASDQLSEQEVEERAKWFIQARYSDPCDQLEVSSVEVIESSRASVQLRATSGWRYDIDLWIESGLVTVGRVRRFRD